jgi:hypothetical protein
MISFAPARISVRKASEKARSQQIRMPMGPRGVAMTVCGGCCGAWWVLGVRIGRSGCQRLVLV